MMRVLVCGGRDYSDKASVYAALDTLAGVTEATPLGVPITVIHGGARGADSLADGWSADNWNQTIRFPADWNTHGKAAGPIRNQQMLDEGKPDLVVAFPGGAGTADMVRRARKAGVEVREIRT